MTFLFVLYMAVQVAKKSNMLLIGRQEAEIEVCVDIVTRKENSVDKALLFVVSSLHDESKVGVQEKATNLTK